MNILIIGLIAMVNLCARGQSLEQSFCSPPDEVKPWVIWFWINGNISRDGITKDLESMKRVGIGGVIWMEVSGPSWAPRGPIETESKEWYDTIQWAIAEADRLGLVFSLTIDSGYGSGGPHITPDLSMQKLVWGTTRVKGGKSLEVTLEKPTVDTQPKTVWLRPGEQLNPAVTKALKDIDSYRDVAVFALRSTTLKNSRLFPSNAKAYAETYLKCIPGLHGADHDPLLAFDGRGWKTDLPPLDSVTPVGSGDVIDLTDQMDAGGELLWDAPEGEWTVVRLGYGTNVKMTRPSPNPVVGLECDRMHPRGIEAHFRQRVKPILDAAGDRAGRTLRYVHLDSWEALGQNWSKGFADEFRKRRGYDIAPWLPVLTGHAVDSIDSTERFLWDLRMTVSEVTLVNYIDRLRELADPYNVGFSCEPYGRVCVNALDYACRSDFPIGEFWTERRIQRPFPTFSQYWYNSMKGLASVANTYGKQRVGAEAFTGCRGWVDHPYLIKSMGDEAFCGGINHYAIHLSAHQAYDNMKPGLTHRRWGQHVNRHQSWWKLSKPWFDYVARSQFLLQQGRRVVDVACLYHEGAPLNFNDIKFALPSGYDYDICTPEIIRRMRVEGGRIHIPTGVSYRYLVLPRSGRLTLPIVRTVEKLRKAGASIYLQTPIAGTPGLEGYPDADKKVKEIAERWPLLPEGGWNDVFTADKLKPDFEGEELRWIHRRTGEIDIYFVANSKPEPMKRKCTFRTMAGTAELWNPETGEIFALTAIDQGGGRTSAELEFDPAQSWFVVFRDQPSEGQSTYAPFASWHAVLEIEGDWSVTFDPEWGPEKRQAFDNLQSWSTHTDPQVKYYSGTAVYRKAFEASVDEVGGAYKRMSLDLGNVEVMARVTLNGKECGIAWKPPYRVDVTHALRVGLNELEVEVVNTWVNRMIGDEQVDVDAEWKDWETLLEWPAWFKNGDKRPAGRYTFTTGRHYKKSSPLMPSGLLGPVRIIADQR